MKYEFNIERNTGYTSDQAVHQYLIYHGNLNIKMGL
jgi:hypothetical protein